MTKKIEVGEVEEVEKVKVCGHVNKHYHNIKGVLEDLPCSLSSGHEGDHFSKHLALRQVEDNFETAERVANGEKTYVIAGKTYMAIEVDGIWSREAGVPAKDIKPDPEQLRQLKLKRRAEEEESI